MPAAYDRATPFCSGSSGECADTVMATQKRGGPEEASRAGGDAAFLLRLDAADAADGRDQPHVLDGLGPVVEQAGGEGRRGELEVALDEPAHLLEVLGVGALGLHQRGVEPGGQLRVGVPYERLAARHAGAEVVADGPE